MESPPGPFTIIDGRRYLYFAGTSYLGLQGHPEVIEAGIAALRQYGVHSGTTRTGFGTTSPVLDVERRASDFFGSESAFYFSSGYVSNHVLIQAFADRIDAVFVEESAHFCVLEASRIAGVPCHAFRSRDAGHLERQLTLHLPARGRPLVMGDAVAPPNGLLAPLNDYLEILARFAPAVLLLDDAHGFGVLGDRGRGLYEHCDLWQDTNSGMARADGITLAAGGTLAKALGGFGGIVPGSHAFVLKARSSSHYFDGASAPASAIAGSSAKALELALREPSLRLQLRANATQLRIGLRDLGLEIADTPAAQVGVVIGDAENMRRLHAELKAQGILVPYLSSYSGLCPKGMIRIAVNALHTPAMITQLLDALKPLI